MHSVQDGSSSLRPSIHGKEVFVVKTLENLSEHLKRESPDCLLPALELTISRTIDGNNIELFREGDSDKVLVQNPGKILA